MAGMTNRGPVSLRLVCNALAALALVFAFVPAAPAADADASALNGSIEQQVKALALAGTRHAGEGVTRVDVQVGELDPRLHLAPCQHIEPYLPSGSRLWGKTRVGLRCTQGATHWNVYLPVTVRLLGPGLVATVPLAVGTVITDNDVIQAEVDLAEDRSAALVDPRQAVGRTVARAVNPGRSLREDNLKTRQWCAAGDTVKVVAKGKGFSVAGEARAMTPGLEGHVARVRTESGHVLTGMPVGERRIELAM
jgi:flagella basal body P-ring formation protein FlgA